VSKRAKQITEGRNLNLPGVSPPIRRGTDCLNTTFNWNTFLSMNPNIEIDIRNLAITNSVIVTPIIPAKSVFPSVESLIEVSRCKGSAKSTVFHSLRPHRDNKPD